MNRLAKTLFLTATAAAITLSSIGVASADDWRYRNNYHHGGNDALVGGAVGLATGLIVGSAIASAPRYEERRYIDPPYEYEDAPVYRAPPPRYYRPVPVRAGVEPWTPQWERYCSYRYRSFDSRSGTFIGNDGRSHFCVAN
jgi:hypothetical protein